MNAKQTAMKAAAGLVGLALSLMLIACSPAVEPTAQPTLEPTAAPGVELAEQFSAEENGQTYRLSYPAGWVASGDSGQIVVASSQEALDLISSTPVEQVTLPEGSYAMQIQALSSAELPPDVDTPMGLMSMMTQSGGEGGPTFGTPEEMEVNGNSAAQASMTLPESSGEISIHQIGDTFLLVVAASPSYADYQATTDAILQTLNVE